MVERLDLGNYKLWVETKRENKTFSEESEKKFMEQEKTPDGKSIREIEVSKPWAQEIFSGRKKVEVRKNNPENWGVTKVGDVLRVKEKGSGESKLFSVTETRTYSNLFECVVAEGVRHLLPGKTTIEEANAVYLSFDGADEEALEKRRWEFGYFGCIAIELRPYESDGLGSIMHRLAREGQLGELVYADSDLIMIKQPRDRAIGKKTYAAVPASTKNDTAKAIQTHIDGSSRPEGDPNCSHKTAEGKTTIVYNDDTMGGCGSGWERMCEACGKVWR